jgi:hypothetical protein
MTNHSVFYRSSRAQVLSITVDAASKWLRNEKGLDFLYLFKCKKFVLQHALAQALLCIAVMRIRILIRNRIYRIHMFLCLPNPDPDPLVRSMDPDPDPSKPAKIVRKTLIPTIL